MSTICKICIRAKEDEVITHLEEILFNAEHEFSVNVSPRPLTITESDSFHEGQAHPTILSCTQATSKTTEIHFNSFNKMEELSSQLSKKLGGSVVVNIYQGTVAAGSWAYHDNGELLREVTFGDGQISVDSGDKLHFEEEQTGRDVSEEHEDVYYVFDCEDMNLYNHKAGVGVQVHHATSSEWTNFKIERTEKTSVVEEIIDPNWWKIW